MRKAMPEIQKYSLIEKLREADNQLQGSPSLLGMSMLTYPNYINSMRSTMFTSHLKQFLNLLQPDFPLVFTNNENLVGKYSYGYKRAKHKLTVFRKIVKFEELVDTPRIYKLFTFDEEEQKYDVITRTVCEDLTENFGFEYNNGVIDGFQEGDIIEKDTVLYRSTSYDEDMNYSYGRNVMVMYTLDPYTSEDAAIASESMAKDFTSIETETMKIGLNNNDFLINLYGSKKEYKPLPDIGEMVSDRLAVVRRQYNNQLLFDFKDSSLREIHEGDDIYYIDKNVEIVDYTIYDNNDEEVDNPFYDQINKYLHAQQDYYQEIKETCEEIFDSGLAYTREIDYLYKRSKEMLDKSKKWKEDNVFGNMVIEITIKRNVPLAKGCKITGRYGNKSVISKILKDEEMPYTKDGRRVDLMINLLAIINRTTAFLLYEMFINNASYKIREKMRSLSFSEQEAMLFEYIGVLNEGQAQEMYEFYCKLPKKKRESYVLDAIENGIYIHQLPMWETKPIFYRCQALLQKYPFLCSDTIYIKKWGREYKVLTPQMIGEMYIMKLKQSDRRGFSARSTGALDTRSLPTRSFKSRSHLERISTTCVRFGEFESLNFSIGMPSIDIALFHALYRTSIKGRKDIVRGMFEEEGVVQLIDPFYTSRVAEQFQVILKGLGIGLDFIDDDDAVRAYDDTVISQHDIDGQSYLCTEYQALLLERAVEIRNEILQKNPILTESMLQEMIEKEMKSKKYINGPLNEELDGFEIRLKEELDREYERQMAACNPVEENPESEEGILVMDSLVEDKEAVN